MSKPPSKRSSPCKTGKPVFKSDKLTAAAWAHATAAAEKWNQPGVFTTLHGFEWTSAPGGNNLHRTVIFRDNADRVNQVVPFSAFDSQDPADLWKYMDGYAKKTGGQVLAIPHNGNLSMGIMFTAETFDGKPMDRAYAEARISHEPLMEVTQIKGDSETHPFLSPNDEFADFERWDVDFGKMEPAPNSVLHGNYARSALKLGLELEAKLGANPYQSGMIGGSDAHMGVITTREDNFFGEFANGLPSPERWKTPLVMIDNDPDKARWSRSGMNRLRAWAACGRARTPARRSGTRSSARKSMPPRATGRPCACSRAGTSRRRTSIAPTSRRTATPMACPWAAISARRRPASDPSSWSTRLRDPDGPNLDRIQIIKGWLGKDGKTQRAHLRRGGLRRAQDRRGWPLQDPGRQHGGRGQRDLQQHHRRPAPVGVLEGPGVRCEAARVLLRARDPNPVAALDGL